MLKDMRNQDSDTMSEFRLDYSDSLTFNGAAKGTKSNVIPAMDLEHYVRLVMGFQEQTERWDLSSWGLGVRKWLLIKARVK